MSPDDVPYYRRVMEPALDLARKALETALPGFRFVVVIAREVEDRPGHIMYSTGSNLCAHASAHLLGVALQRIVSMPPDPADIPPDPNGTMH